MAYLNQRKIRNNRVELYQRDDSSNWYAAIRIPLQKTIRTSLRTPDEEEARVIALDKYYDLEQRLKRGLTIRNTPFASVAKAYMHEFACEVENQKKLPRLEQTHKQSRLNWIRSTIEKYLIQFFQKDITEITTIDVEKYKNQWRKSYWTTGPGSKVDEIFYTREFNGRTYKSSRKRLPREKRSPSYNTVNKELTILRKIFEYALLNQIIDESQIPVIKNVTKPRNVPENKKPGLRPDELIRLMEAIESKMDNQTNIKHKRSHNLLWYYAAILSTTGMRVAEAKNLSLKNIESFKKNGTHYYGITVEGKGKTRQLIALDEFAGYYQGLVLFHESNASINGWELTEDTPLFVDQYGKQINSFKNGLDSALKKAELLHTNTGKRSAGCFRKFYITQAILRGVDYLLLASQCGTSLEVIQQYYAEISSDAHPEKLQWGGLIGNSPTPME